MASPALVVEVPLACLVQDGQKLELCEAPCRRLGIWAPPVPWLQHLLQGHLDLNVRVLGLHVLPRECSEGYN